VAVILPVKSGGSWVGPDGVVVTPGPGGPVYTVCPAPIPEWT
jgi:hypothetical protein